MKMELSKTISRAEVIEIVLDDIRTELTQERKKLQAEHRELYEKFSVAMGKFQSTINCSKVQAAAAKKYGFTDEDSPESCLYGNTVRVSWYSSEKRRNVIWIESPLPAKLQKLGERVKATYIALMEARDRCQKLERGRKSLKVKLLRAMIKEVGKVDDVEALIEAMRGQRGSFLKQLDASTLP